MNGGAFVSKIPKLLEEVPEPIVKWYRKDVYLFAG